MKAPGKFSFSAFIITYERPEILKKTVQKILEQTFPPEKILIIDNSKTALTQEVVASLNNLPIEYYRMGYNAGPAGAAKIGLSRLAAEGYEWIYWGDDDNPPDFDTAFESLLEIPQSHTNLSIGVLGAVGQFFNRSTGNIIRVEDSAIKTSNIIEVDSIAGGMSMIVNSEVIKRDVLPEASLFFGFEELDFCLKVKKAGFKLVVSSELFLKSRTKYNRITFRPPLYAVKSYEGLSRQYYSIRNSLWILKWHNLYSAFFYQLMKAIIKCGIGFRYGFRYGLKNFRKMSSGIWDGVIK